MKRLILAAVLVFSTLHVGAAPIVFTDSSWFTTTFSSAGGAFDSASDSSPTTPLPLLTSSPTADLDATASGDAIADANLLSALATAIGSLDGSAAGLASSAFLGSFIAPGGQLNLLLDIDTSATSAQGAGTCDGGVRVTLVSGTDYLIDEIVRMTGVLDRVFDIPYGTQGFLSIEAFGSADAIGLGDIAVGGANVTFGVNAVPEPTGLALLMAAALAAVLVPRVSRRRARVAPMVG